MKTAKSIMSLLSLVAGYLIIILALVTEKTIPAIVGVGILITNAIDVARMEISENIRDEIRQAVATMIAWNSSKNHTSLEHETRQVKNYGVCIAINPKSFKSTPDDIEAIHAKG